MQVTVEIPDDIAGQLLGDSTNAARALLESAALQAHREHRLTEYQLQVLLGIESRFDLWDFLKAHHVEGTDTVESVERDLARLSAARQVEGERRQG